MTGVVTAAGRLRGIALGRLLPCAIAALFVVDVMARFLPLDPLCFQAWECLTRYQEPGGIFEANRQFRSRQTHGNLSNMGNLPHVRQVRPQVFTTDANGFRNLPASGTIRTDGIVVGDSFVAGYGISDAETLPAQLSDLTGLHFYNAGGPYAYLETARALKPKLGLQQSRVVVVWTEAEPIATLQRAEALARNPDWKGRLLTSVLGRRADYARGLLRGWWFTSPVKIAAEKAYLSISDDRILPNVYARRVIQRRLRTGEMMLFYPPEVDDFHSSRDAQPAADYLERLSTGLKREGLDALVVLAPSKYSVYYPLLEDPKPEPGDAVHPLARLAAAVGAAGVPVLDLTGPFRERAREDLANGQYIYWLDDTHWNARGIAVAAESARKAWFKEAN